MTTQIPATRFADPAPVEHLERAAAALRSHGFTAEILDDAAAARIRVKDLIPEGASVLTGASETLRLSGIDADINTSGRYQAIRPQTLAMDRVTAADDIRRLRATPTSSWAASTRSPKPAPSWPPRAPAASYPPTPAAPPARSGSPGRRRWSPTCPPRCAASKTTASRWKAPAPRQPTGPQAPSTACSSS